MNKLLSQLRIDYDHWLNQSERIASLDYWRAIAILLVLFVHFFEGPHRLGYLGVQIFFVLSGFLVSKGLIADVFGKSKIRIWSFYKRRFIRILPSYYCFLIVGSFIASFAARDPGSVMIRNDDWWSFVFFFKNYNFTNPSAFGHLWSLCVEEHFYLTLPLVILLSVSIGIPRVMLMPVAAGILLLPTLLRLVTHLMIDRGYPPSLTDPAATHNNLDAFIVGLFLRLLIERKLQFGRYSRALLFVIAISVLAISTYCAARGGNFFYSAIFARLVDSVAIASLVYCTIGFRRRWLAPLQVLAFYSFNVYLWHLSAKYLVRDWFKADFISFTGYVFTSLFLACVFTHLVELVPYRFNERRLRREREEPARRAS